jgi:acetyl-CoA acetyltransferase
MARVYVIGVGMTKFEKPGVRDWDYPDMVREAGTAALADAGIRYEHVRQAVAGYCYGDSTCGQRAIYELGLTGIPIYNVNNNCATGATALYLAKQLVEGGMAECVLAVGFEKMQRGPISLTCEGRTNPLGRYMSRIEELSGPSDAPVAPRLFSSAAREHMVRYGTTARQLAAVAAKNHRHSVHNPCAQFRDAYSIEQVLASPMVCDPLTRLQCCPTSEGAAAAVIASEDFVRSRGLGERAVEIAAMAMATDTPKTFEDGCISVVGADVSHRAAQAVYEAAGIGPGDVDVIELHDCFSSNEVITYEALGLCEVGRGGELAESGATTYGGQVVVNPSGGLISKGHPLGATGVAQCAELVWQLRGQAGGRQVAGARRALQHNLGLGSAAAVAIYCREG